jgi:hypothetical protein
MPFSLMPPLFSLSFEPPLRHFRYADIFFDDTDYAADFSFDIDYCIFDASYAAAIFAILFIFAIFRYFAAISRHLFRRC